MLVVAVIWGDTFAWQVLPSSAGLFVVTVFWADTSTCLNFFFPPLAAYLGSYSVMVGLPVRFFCFLASNFSSYSVV